MASNSSSTGKAVHIANIKENKVNIDTVTFNKIIDKVGDHPMSIVSVNGPLRSGKSYILGYFLRYLSASENDDWFTNELDEKFHWRNSSEPQTRGILMWSEPFFIDRNGKKVAILLIDTQGCFDEMTTGQENSAIFALSCLLSSVLIFNVKNLISEEIYQNLRMFIGYASMTKDSGQSESFSNLVFLIRDWECPTEFEFGYHDDITSPGPKNFKKEKVDVKPGMSPEAEFVRNSILESFEKVGCCLMPHPGRKLANYDNEEKLKQDFIDTIKDFVPRIFDNSNICRKKICGEEINGKDFKRIVQKWAKCFDQYYFPEVSCVAEASAKFHNQKALEIALGFYRKQMSNEVNMIDRDSEDIIEEVHKKNKEEAIAIFNRIKRIKHDDIKSQYMDKLEEHIQEAFETYNQINCFKRIALESKRNLEEETKQLKEQIKRLERRQEATTNIMTQPEGYLTVKFVNNTDSNITLYWKNHNFSYSKEFVIEPEVTKSCSFYAYKNLLWSTKYKSIIRYGNKRAEFWAFGKGAPKEENIFTVKSDGIYLRDGKHSNWENTKTFAANFVNETDSNITLYWNSNYIEPLADKFVIDSGGIKSFSFYPYDNYNLSINYKAIIVYDNKVAVFWAFGGNAPREENIFYVKSDGIFLCNNQHKNWDSNPAILKSITRR
jgi:atlastin